MILIQYIFIPILAFLLVYFFRKLRRRPRIRILVMLILLTGMYFLIFPDQSTQIASFMGIGRGVDLIIYLSLLGLTVSCVLLYLRTLHLQEQIHEIVREQALIQAENRTEAEKNT